MIPFHAHAAEPPGVQQPARVAVLGDDRIPISKAGVNLHRKEADRLHRLLHEAIMALRNAGAERAANRLEPAMRGQ